MLLFVITKLHVGDEVLVKGTIRRFTVHRLADYDRVRHRIITPLDLPATDPINYWEHVGVVVVRDDLTKPMRGIILGWTHLNAGRYIEDELGRRVLLSPKRLEVLCAQPWDASGKYRKHIYCLLEDLEW